MPRRRHGGVVTAVAALTALAAVIAAPSPASAHTVRSSHTKDGSTSPYFYIGHAGGTQVQALGTTIRSDLTAASGVEGFTFPAHDDNRAAGVNVGSGLVKVGVVTTLGERRAGRQRHQDDHRGPHRRPLPARRPDQGRRRRDRHDGHEDTGRRHLELVHEVHRPDHRRSGVPGEPAEGLHHHDPRHRRDRGELIDGVHAGRRHLRHGVRPVRRVAQAVQGRARDRDRAAQPDPVDRRTGAPSGGAPDRRARVQLRDQGERRSGARPRRRSERVRLDAAGRHRGRDHPERDRRGHGAERAARGGREVVDDRQDRARATGRSRSTTSSPGSTCSTA